MIAANKSQPQPAIPLDARIIVPTTQATEGKLRINKVNAVFIKRIEIETCVGQAPLLPPLLKKTTFWSLCPFSVPVLQLAHRIRDSGKIPEKVDAL